MTLLMMIDQWNDGIYDLDLNIETVDDQWQQRLQTWRKALLNSNGKTDCPCPLPEGHIVFDGNSPAYEKIEEQRAAYQSTMF